MLMSELSPREIARKYHTSITEAWEIANDTKEDNNNKTNNNLDAGSDTPNKTVLPTENNVIKKTEDETIKRLEEMVIEQRELLRKRTSHLLPYSQATEEARDEVVRLTATMSWSEAVRSAGYSPFEPEEKKEEKVDQKTSNEREMTQEEINRIGVEMCRKALEAEGIKSNLID